jgi:hypothetical protein
MLDVASAVQITAWFEKLSSSASTGSILMALSLNAVDCGLLYRNHIDPREAPPIV